MWRPVALIVFMSMSLGLAPVPGAHADSGAVRRFAELPRGAAGHPEGLTADADGNIYAASFELTPPPQLPYNFIYTFDRRGRLKALTPLPAGVIPLGMVVKEGELYVNDVFNGDVLRYTLPLSALSVPAQTYDICGGFVVAFGALGEFCALNANDVGPDGRIYMSDNGAGPPFVPAPGFLNGRIFVLDPTTGASSVFFDDPALDIPEGGFPPFGVNGVAFAPDGSALYMANMSTDTIYKLTLNNCDEECTPGALSKFIEGNGIDGPDNMDFDDHGNLWVASGQNDSVVGINRRGKVIKRVGSFKGFTDDGVPKGLLQPSGLVFSLGKIYVGNEANQSLRPPTDPIDWDQLQVFTISRFDLHSPESD